MSLSLSVRIPHLEKKKKKTNYSWPALIMPQRDLSYSAGGVNPDWNLTYKTTCCDWSHAHISRFVWGCTLQGATLSAFSLGKTKNGNRATQFGEQACHYGGNPSLSPVWLSSKHSRTTCRLNKPTSSDFPLFTSLWCDGVSKGSNFQAVAYR